VSATIIVPSVAGGPALERLLESLAAQTRPTETIVVDNGSPEDAVGAVVKRFDFAEHLRLEENVGYGRAVNLAARQSSSDTLVLLNDDCVCRPQFVAELVPALSPRDGIVMAAGVLLEAHDPETIDTAGMELDSTLLVFDYLNGEPTASLGPDTPDPIGPCAAASAFDRSAFLEVGGFDERLFAYWEDVDLVLRLRNAGARCVLCPDARGTHEHSATLGSGSSRKNYLMGFGNGYVTRKWSVLDSPSRAARALGQAAVLCAGQAVLDRTVSGVRGRLDGFAAAADIPKLAFPEEALKEQPGRPQGLTRRLRRRFRLDKR
jgi:GT2 family glycosyltransferase